MLWLGLSWFSRHLSSLAQCLGSGPFLACCLGSKTRSAVTGKSHWPGGLGLGWRSSMTVLVSGSYVWGFRNWIRISENGWDQRLDFSISSVIPAGASRTQLAESRKAHLQHLRSTNSIVGHCLLGLLTQVKFYQSFISWYRTFSILTLEQSFVTMGTAWKNHLYQNEFYPIQRAFWQTVMVGLWINK